MESTYYSKKKYSQEEFKKIVFDVYEKVCYTYIESDVQSTCFPNIFFGVEDSIFSEKFDEIIEKDYGLKRLSECLTGRVFFNLRDDEYNEVEDILLNLDIDKSCYNDCWKLDDGIEDKFRFRENCLISMILNGE